MSVSAQDLLERNRQNAAKHESIPSIPELGEPPHLVILTCIDPRVLPERIFNLNIGDASIIRTAGANVHNALSDIAVLDAFIGIESLMIVKHTDCGATYWTDESVREKLVQKGVDKKAVDSVATFGPIKNLEDSARKNIEEIKASPLLSQQVKDGTTAYLFDMKSGLVRKVE